MFALSHQLFPPCRALPRQEAILSVGSAVDNMKRFGDDRSMDAEPNISTIGALIGDPGRANMLSVLMDGRALTAKELAYFAGVTPQTASSHLAKLTSGGLIQMEKQGRHRYYRIANSAVAEAVEALMVIATDRGPPRVSTGPNSEAMRLARTCYDHLAGKLGVAMTAAMTERKYLHPQQRDFRLTDAGERFLSELGVELESARGKRRAFARQCLDWSERQTHLAGSLGAALAERCFTLGWLARVPDSRTVLITPKGEKELAERFEFKMP